MQIKEIKRKRGISVIVYKKKAELKVKLVLCNVVDEVCQVPLDSAIFAAKQIS